MSKFATHMLSTVLLPPFCLVLAIAAGLLVARRRPRMGRGIAWSGVALLYVLSTPWLGRSLLQTLEPRPLDLDNPLKAQAIIVLGGGTYFAAPEYGGDTLGRASLERVRYAAQLYRTLGKPVLVTGGTPLGSTAPEAALMAAALNIEFGIPVAWRETAAENTLQNALGSRTLLQPAGIRSIYLVTHAWHMPRARLSFEHAGFEVFAAPTGFATHRASAVLDYLPDWQGLRDSAIALHEMLGLVWYRLKFALA